MSLVIKVKTAEQTPQDNKSSSLVQVTKMNVKVPSPNGSLSDSPEASTSTRSIASKSCNTSTSSQSPMGMAMSPVSPDSTNSNNAISPSSLQSPSVIKTPRQSPMGFPAQAGENKHKKSVEAPLKKATNQPPPPKTAVAAATETKKDTPKQQQQKPRRKSFTFKESKGNTGKTKASDATDSKQSNGKPKDPSPKDAASLGEPICPKQQDFFLLHGIDDVSKISRTLQGFVLKGTAMTNDEQVIVKMTDRELHKYGITVKNGMKIRVKENIIKETRLMSYISQHGNPREFTNILDFFTDANFYYLVMQNGGSDLFHWVVLNHERIRKRQLAKKQWQDHVQLLFAQMVNFVLFLNTLHCCHLDISLENLLIKHAIYDDKTMLLDNAKVQIKFIDFGLAELFPKDNFLCRKYVGKQHYKCPKIYGKQEIFDARLADVWSLCITLFMMLIGAPPFQKPISTDSTFNAIYNKGKMRDVLIAWKRQKYMPEPAYDLLSRVFVPEHKRLTIEQVANHPYVKGTLRSYRLKCAAQDNSNNNNSAAAAVGLRVTGSLSNTSSSSNITVKTNTADTPKKSSNIIKK